MAVPVTAGDVMSTRFRVVRPSDAVYDLVKEMLRERYTCAAVVDGEGRLVGVLSEQECVRSLVRAVGDRQPPTLVEDVMVRDPVSVDEDTHLLTLAHRFLVDRVCALPVLREGELVGMVTRRELLDGAVRVFEKAPDREAAIIYLSALDRGLPSWAHTPGPSPRRRGG